MIYDLLFICAHMIRMPCDGCTCVYILHGSFNLNLQAVCVIVREHRLHLRLEESITKNPVKTINNATFSECSLVKNVHRKVDSWFT